MLLAMLCGLASANTNESITLGSWFTNTEKQDVYTVDAVQLKSKGIPPDWGFPGRMG